MKGKSFWIAFLSDGQVVRQSELDDLGNRKTAWLQLIDYLQQHSEITIQSIQIVVNGIIYNTPTISKYAEKKNDGDPCHFWFYQKHGMIVYGNDAGKTDNYYGISYRVGKFRHYMWINVDNNEVHVEICDIEKEYRESLIEEFFLTRTLKNE